MTLVALLAAAGAALGSLGLASLIESLLALRRRRAKASAWIAVRSLLGRAAPRLVASRLAARAISTEKLAERILAAGEPGGLGTREWISLKALLSLAVTLALIPLAAASPGRLGVAVIMVAPFTGALLPDFWLGRAARLRVERALAQLPDMLDLMSVSVQAGMSPLRALSTVAGQLDGPLAEECHRVALAIGYGAPSATALALLSKRLPHPHIKTLTETLRGSARHGSSAADALGSLAAAARHDARQRVRERAAKAGPKIQLVVALVLVPSVLAVVAAGMAVQLGGGIGTP